MDWIGWKKDPKTGRQVRLVRTREGGPLLLQWDNDKGPTTPYKPPTPSSAGATKASTPANTTTTAGPSYTGRSGRSATIPTGSGDSSTPRTQGVKTSTGVTVPSEARANTSSNLPFRGRSASASHTAAFPSAQYKAVAAQASAALPGSRSNQALEAVEYGSEVSDSSGSGYGSDRGRTGKRAQAEPFFVPDQAGLDEALLMTFITAILGKRSTCKRGIFRDRRGFMVTPEREFTKDHEGLLEAFQQRLAARPPAKKTTGTPASQPRPRIAGPSAQPASSKITAHPSHKHDGGDSEDSNEDTVKASSPQNSQSESEEEEEEESDNDDDNNDESSQQRGKTARVIGKKQEAPQRRGSATGTKSSKAKGGFLGLRRR